MKNELTEVTRSYRQWVVHDEKKRPFQVASGYFASVVDSSTWTDYDSVAGKQRKGFVLTLEDPFTVIDLDHCVGSHGRIGKYTSRIIMYFQSYTELSPSGTGIHIWVKGRLPAAIKREMFELYSEKRYMTITENPLFNVPIVNCQKKLDDIYRKHGRPVSLGPVDVGESVECLDDLRRLYRVSSYFRKVWDLGCDFKKADGGPDWSGYDLALAGLLKNWSSEQIFWALQYFRTHHGANVKHRKALEITIAKAKEKS
jgi:hypothetical protein